MWFFNKLGAGARGISFGVRSLCAESSVEDLFNELLTVAVNSRAGGSWGIAGIKGHIHSRRHA